MSDKHKKSWIEATQQGLVSAATLPYRLHREASVDPRTGLINAVTQNLNGVFYASTMVVFYNTAKGTLSDTVFLGWVGAFALLKIFDKAGDGPLSLPAPVATAVADKPAPDADSDAPRRAKVGDDEG